MMRKFVYICWVFFLCLPVALLGYSWSFTEVDSPIWDFAFATSITTDDNGVIHILYDRGTTGTDLALRHGVWDSNTRSFTLETVDSIAGIDNNIAIDENGNIHIAYCYVDDFGSFNFDLYYGYYDGTWHTEALETSGMASGFPCHIAIDGNNHPHIAANVNLSPEYFYHDGSTWHNQPVPNVLDPGGIAIDTLDNPFISTAINNGNCAAYYDGYSWSLDTLEIGAACATNSMAMDDLGNLHVAYRYTASGNHLKYAHFYGGTCSTVVVDDNGNTGINPSIAVDCNNHPHISYYSNTDGCLKIASWNGGSWDIETVDNVGGRYSSVAVDGNDNPCIIYDNLSAQSVRFAYVEETGIEEDHKTVVTPHKVEIYPNPFYESVTISASNKPIAVMVYSPSGRLVRTLNPTGSSFMWDGRNNSGMKAPYASYFLNVVFENATVKKRVIMLPSIP